MSDTITVTVLPDGSLKIETDKISMAQHGSAEMLIRELVKGMGGKMTRTSITHTHAHAHDHHHEGEHHAH